MTSPEPKEKAAYGSREFQAAFGIGNTKMHEEIGAGRLKVRYLGRRLIISREDAMAWLNNLPARETSKAA